LILWIEGLRDGLWFTVYGLWVLYLLWNEVNDIHYVKKASQMVGKKIESNKTFELGNLALFTPRYCA
jgi:hypothetical protein